MVGGDLLALGEKTWDSSSVDKRSSGLGCGRPRKVDDWRITFIGPGF